MSKANEENLRYAYSLYYKGVDASGTTRTMYLKQARSVLFNIDDDEKDESILAERDSLLKRIESML